MKAPEKFGTTFRLLLLLFVTSLANACTLEKSSGMSQPFAAVSVYALSPDAPAVNLYLNGNNIGQNIPYGGYTLYNQVISGEASVQIQPVNNSSAFLADTSFSLAEGKYYSFFLTDSFASASVKIVEDKLSTPPQDSVAIRFFHFSPDAPPVDLQANSVRGDSLSTWHNRSFDDVISADSNNLFRRMPAGVYQFVVLRSSNRDTLAVFRDIELRSAGNYTLLLKGFLKSAFGDTTLQLGVRLH